MQIQCGKVNLPRCPNLEYVENVTVTIRIQSLNYLHIISYKLFWLITFEIFFFTKSLSPILPLMQTSLSETHLVMAWITSKYQRRFLNKKKSLVKKQNKNIKRMTIAKIFLSCLCCKHYFSNWINRNKLPANFYHFWNEI